MRAFPCLFVALFLASAALPQGAPDLSVTLGRVGGVPVGWGVTTAGYRAEILPDGGPSGGRCALLTDEASADGAGGRASFGNLMRILDARPFRGQRVRFRCAVRFEGEGGHGAQPWLRVDLPDQRTGFFDNMGDRPIRSAEWAHYEIVGDIASDAQRIALGFMLNSEGRVHVDDVTLEAVAGLETTTPSGPRPLDARGLDNLVALGRLLGYVRHFHPSDEAADADWGALAVDAVGRVEGAADAHELATRLREVFRPLAPTLAIVVDGEDGDPSAAPHPDAGDDLSVVAWRHTGFGQEGGIYTSERVRAPLRPGLFESLLAEEVDDLPAPQEPFVATLPGGVTVHMPLALFADDAGTLPRATAQDAIPAPTRWSAVDRSVRLADVILCWNVFQHFYPYFDVVGTDWEGELRRALAAAAEDEGQLDFLGTLRRLVATLHDGHGSVSHPSDDAWAALPVLFGWIDGELVVTRVADEVEGIAPGDVVVRFDGVAAADVLAAAKGLVSASTPQHLRDGALRLLRQGRINHERTLGLRDADGTTRDVALTHGREHLWLVDPRPDPVAELENGVVYVDVSRVDDGDFREALPRLQEARRIVFDFRGYPGRLDVQTFMPHLIREPVTSAQWHVPQLTRPDRTDMTFRKGGWMVQPRAPYLEAERVFLTDSRAISYAETCMGIVEHYELGEIVGEPTAGTNGNVNPFTLPGGYRVSWTGMKVLKHDGTRHHGLGIIPTLPVQRTREGIAEGRDEVLEAALAMEVDVARG